MRKIKVLHVHTLPVISGSGINTFLTMKGTPKDRFEVSLACAPGGKLNDIVQEAGMQVHEIRNFVQPLHPWKDLLALYEIVKVLKAEKIDLIHTHNSKAGFLGRLAGRIANTSVVVHTVHGFAFHDAESPWRRRLFRSLERRAAPWADHTIYISQPLIDWARNEEILQEGRYAKIYSGIDLSVFHEYGKEEISGLRNDLGIDDRDRVIGFVSKLWEGKGHSVAIQAMTRILMTFPNAKLLLVGDGPLKRPLYEECRELGIDAAVIFAGFRTKIAELISLCDLTILPSFFEGMGRVLLEAGACSKPVVASDVGGIPDVVEHGVTGFLVPPDDVDELSDAIVRLLQDGELCSSMGQNAKRCMNEKYDVRTMIREIIAVYDLYLEDRRRVMNEKPGPSLMDDRNQKQKAV